MECIFVLEAKVVKTTATEYCYAQRHCQELCIEPERYGQVADPTILKEMVQAHRFRTAQGKLVSIGMSQEVQELLEVPMAAFGTMSKEMTKYQRDVFRLTTMNRSLNDEIQRLKNTWGYRLSKNIREYLDML